MASRGRHPACPSETHVVGFVHHLREDRGNEDGVVKQKLFLLNAAYKWWQAKRQFDIPAEYNPFQVVMQEGDLENSSQMERNYQRVSLDEVRSKVKEVTNIRERALMVAALKLGARSTELANINLREINIEHPGVNEHYPELGTHPKNEEYSNSVFIPSEREGNKREVDTILPLDEETRQVIVDWLLIRPDNGKDALFFTDKGKRPAHNDIAYFWRNYWWPEYEYDEEDEFDSITPHWARHFFTTWWSNEGIPRDQSKYMRGDKTNEYNEKRSAIDNYVHEHYEDVEEVYREQIFQLRLDQV